MNELFSTIKSYAKNFEETPLTTNPYFAQRQSEIYDLIDLYWVSRFRDYETDALGDSKIFYNIVNFPVEVASKMLDIDTKNINILAENGVSYYPAWLMEKELHFWMKEKYFGKQLNEYAFMLPKYGDLWVKKVKNDVVIVLPQNMIYQVDAADYKGIPLFEKHEYSPEELEYIGKQHNWENVEKAIDLAKDERILVYETYFPKGYLNSSSNWFVVTPKSEVVLADTSKDLPYKKLAWETLPGRLAGRGNVEKLFEEQIYFNRMANYKSEGLHWTSLHLFQTRDQTVGKNLMTEAENGDVLLVNSEVTPVATEERNLSFYSQEEQRWLDNAFKRTFATEPITGARAPAGTPLGSTVLQAQMAGAYFKQKQENLAMFVKEILWDWVLPEFNKQSHKEHSILMRTLLEDEDNAEKFFNIMLNKRMNDLRRNKYMTEDQWNIRRAIQAEILKNDDLTIPEGYYDDIKYKIDINIVGEAIDTQAKQATLNVIFQVLGSNPTILQDKTARRVFYKMLDMSGINPNDVFSSITPSIEQVAQRGGSIATPPPITTPTMTKTQVSV